MLTKPGAGMMWVLAGAKVRRPESSAQRRMFPSHDPKDRLSLARTCKKRKEIGPTGSEEICSAETCETGDPPRAEKGVL